MASSSDHIKSLIRSGAKAQALSLLSAAIKSNPNDVEAWWLISFAIDDPAKQLYAVQRVLKLSPGNAAAERRLAQLDPMAGISALRQQAVAPPPQPRPVARPQPHVAAPALVHRQTEGAAVIATPRARAWTLGLAAFFVVTIGTALLLTTALRTSAADLRDQQAQQPMEDLEVAPTALPEIVLVLPNDTPADQSQATATLAEVTLTPQATSTPEQLVVVEPTIAPSPTATLEPTSDTLAFDQFVQSVTNGSASSRVGVYVENLFSLPIVQQPNGDPGWITSNFGEVTEFRIVRQHTGNEGLIAHNYLAGGQFYSLQVGDIAELVMGDGSVLEFEIYAIEQYQALTPNSPTSDFLDLATGDKLSASDLFFRVYGGHMTLTFQTCINRDNISTWGRTFIIGEEL
jgi:hypothetical protein